MPYFVVLARERWNGKSIPLTQVKGSVDKAVNIAQNIHKVHGMNRTFVLDEKFKIQFKIERRCRCINCQYEIDGRLVCVDCKRVVPTNPVEMEECV